MSYCLVVDVLVWLYLGFILFVLFGGLLLLCWLCLVWLYLLVVVWGCVVEFFGLFCLLILLENCLCWVVGDVGYSGGFVEYYLLLLIYFVGLILVVQWIFGVIVLLFNLIVYLYLLYCCGSC